LKVWILTGAQTRLHHWIFQNILIKFVSISQIFKKLNISSDDIIVRHPRIHNVICYCPLKLVMSTNDPRFPIYVYSFIMIIVFIISAQYFVNYVRNRRKIAHIAPQQQ
jgi:hypothetical protein